MEGTYRTVEDFLRISGDTERAGQPVGKGEELLDAHQAAEFLSFAGERAVTEGEDSDVDRDLRDLDELLEIAKLPRKVAVTIANLLFSRPRGRPKKRKGRPRKNAIPLNSGRSKAHAAILAMVREKPSLLPSVLKHLEFAGIRRGSLLPAGSGRGFRLLNRLEDGCDFELRMEPRKPSAQFLMEDDPRFTPALFRMMKGWLRDWESNTSDLPKRQLEARKRRAQTYRRRLKAMAKDSPRAMICFLTVDDRRSFAFWVGAGRACPGEDQIELIVERVRQKTRDENYGQETVGRIIDSTDPEERALLKIS